MNEVIVLALINQAAALLALVQQHAAGTPITSDQLKAAQDETQAVYAAALAERSKEVL